MTVFADLVAVGAVGAISLLLLVGVARSLRLAASLRSVGTDGVQIWLTRLLETREPNAYLIFEDMDGSKRFVQFRRGLTERGTSLTCDFPVAPWSRVYIPSLRRLLTEKGYGYSEVQGDAGLNPVEGFVAVRDLTAAEGTELTDSIFRTLFQHDKTRVRCLGSSVIARDKNGRIMRWPIT